VYTVRGVVLTPELLARGPWDPADLEISWRADPFELAAAQEAEADLVLERLRQRGSPSHDGLAARLVDFQVSGPALKLELQPTRWALRLLSDAGSSISALCVVRDANGGWLAGRRAGWVASWAGRWALGAGGSVEVDENPAETLARELLEEWSVQPERLQVEALVRLANGMVMLIGQAWLAPGASVEPDAEHDAYAWWPAEIDRWPAEADAPLRLMGTMLAGA
jgi:ADP-ribose pyrophosphatase YjhB (NUDIX family)